MKKNYLSPVIDIVEINAVDIITASGTGLSDNSLDPSVWSDFYDFDEQYYCKYKTPRRKSSGIFYTNF